MADIQEYKCPCCGGVVEFDSKTQKMKCPYCDSEFELEALKSYDEALTGEEEAAEPDWGEAAGSEWSEGEADGLKTYVCKSCGGEIVVDSTTAASSCPYCGNPIVLMGQFKGDLKPNYVIPFKLDKEAAKKAMKQHFEGKKLLPKVFKSQNHLDEIKGVYVPFWLFDADADASYRFEAVQEHEYDEGDYECTERRFYSVIRKGYMGFDNIPVDGASKMPDDLMESLEPFDFAEAKDFQTAYLSGYLADRYDVDEKQSVARANERVAQSTERAIRSTVRGYDEVTTKASNIRLSNAKTKYALYPVWLLNTSWKGEKFTFAMNGQTGKFVGNLPMDKGAFWAWFLGLFLGIGAVISAAMCIYNGVFEATYLGIGFGVGLIIALIVSLSMKGKLKSVAMQSGAADYIRGDGLKLTAKDDIFLYSRVERRRKPQEDKRD